VKWYRHHLYWALRQAVPKGCAAATREKALGAAWAELRRRLSDEPKGSLDEFGFRAGSAAEKCLRDRASSTADLPKTLAEWVRDSAKSCLCGASIDYAAMLGDYRGHVERAQEPDICTNRPKLVETAWTRLRTAWHERLLIARVDATQEACLKARLISDARAKIDEHITFWTRNPNAPRGHLVLEQVGEALCATIAKPICDTVKLVKAIGGFVERVRSRGGIGPALQSYWDDLRTAAEREWAFVKERLEAVFVTFKDALTVDRTFNPGRVDPFIARVRTTTSELLTRLNSNLGIPRALSELLNPMVGAILGEALRLPTLGIAALNFGVRKLMELLIPELVLGTGELANAALRVDASVRPLLQGLVSALQETLRAFGLGGDASSGAGGIIGTLVRDEAARNRLRGVFEKAANIAGRVRQLALMALRVGASAGGGGASGAKDRLATLERAMNEAASAPRASTMTQAEQREALRALLDFAREEIWKALRPPLEKAWGLAWTAINRLLDVPRNALVGAIGTVPYVGGLLAAALNLGLGVLVELVNGYLSQFVMQMAEEQVKATLAGVQDAILRKLDSPRGVPATASLMRLLDFARKMAIEVEARTQRFAAGFAGPGAALTTELRTLVLGASSHAGVRGLLDRAIGDFVKDLGHGSTSDLARPLARVLHGLSGRVAATLTEGVTPPSLRTATSRAVQDALQELAHADRLRAALDHAGGFTAAVAARASVLLRGRTDALFSVSGDAAAAARTLQDDLSGALGQAGFDGFARVHTFLREGAMRLTHAARTALAGAAADPTMRELLRTAGGAR
jgi:hypothetical protein